MRPNKSSTSIRPYPQIFNYYNGNLQETLVTGHTPWELKFGGSCCLAALVRRWPQHNTTQHSLPPYDLSSSRPFTTFKVNNGQLHILTQSLVCSQGYMFKASVCFAVAEHAGCRAYAGCGLTMSTSIPMWRFLYRSIK